MKINKTTIVALAVLAGFAVLGIKGKGLLKERKEEVAKTPLPAVERITVPVVYAHQGVLTQKMSFQAQLLATQSIKLSTKLAGFVEKLYVKESKFVKKGTPLVKIDAVEVQSGIDALKSALAAQKNDLAVAKSIYSRNKKLYEVGGLAKEKLDLSHAALKAKSANVENTRQKLAQLTHQLGYLQIKAPFDGIIDRLMLHEGDLAAAGKPILSMSTQTQKILFSFAPSLMGTVKEGDSVWYKGAEIGRVRTIYNSSQNGLVTAEATLHETIDLPVGSSLQIDLLTDRKEGCVVPAGTLMHKKEGNYLLVYEQGRFTPLKIDLLLSSGDQALITPCPKKAIAKASEVKLAALPAYSHVEITGEKDE